MSRFERLESILSSPIPWTADLSYWIDGRVNEGTANPDWLTEQGFLELHRSLGVFPYYRYTHFWAGEPAYDTGVEVSRDETGRQITTTWRTPKGRITEIRQFVPESSSWAHVKFAVETDEDLAVFASLIERRRMKATHLDDYGERYRRWQSYGGLPAIALPRIPLSAFFYEWAGVVNGVYLIADNKDLVGEIFALMGEQETPLLDELCRVRPPLVHFADNVSADNMAGYFDRYMRPVYEERLTRLRPAGVLTAVHLDGKVEGILHPLVSVGIDAIEALTPYPGGDLTVDRLRDEAGSDEVLLWGGVPGIMFSPAFPREGLRSHVRQVIECWKGTPFILGVADQVPADGDIERIQDIGNWITEYGNG